MLNGLIIDGLQYVGYALELGLLVLLLRRGFACRLAALCFYVSIYFVVDAVLRPWALHRHGAGSVEYFYLYWLSDALLSLCTFSLVCALFQRACAHNQEVWNFIRP